MGIRMVANKSGWNKKLIMATPAAFVVLLWSLFDSSSGLFQCPFHALTGFDCPGCGLQRSLILLFRGDLQASIQMYWATIPVLMMFIYCLLFLRYRSEKGLKALLFFFSLNSALIFCNYFYKISHSI
jgi:hypothetical protein